MSRGYKENKIKQVFIHETLEVGGAEMLRKAFVSFVRNHEEWKQRFDITIVCLRSRGEVGEWIENQGVRVIALDWQGELPSWRLLFRLRKVLRELCPDVVHTCLFQAHRHGVLAARMARIKNIMLEEHGDNFWMGWRERWLMRVLAFFTSRVLAVSQSHAEHLIAYMRYPRKKVVVLLNCVDIERLCQYKNNALKKSEIFSIVTIGSLRKIKNIPLILEAFALCVREEPNCILSIVGDGELKNNLVRMAQKLGIDDKVNFLGIRDDIGTILHCADIYVHAGYSESFCIAMAEALCLGRPCVLPDCAVFREITEHGKFALLVKKNDSQALKDNLVELMRSRERRREMGEKGRLHAQTQFHPKRYVHDLISIYRKHLRLGQG